MKNMNQMMKQVKKMQAEMMKAQEELANQTVEGTAGGGVVKVTANGQKQVTEIVIDPEVVDPDDVEMLQDLVLAAIKDAMDKADQLANDNLGKFAGGMNLPPGLF